MKVAGKRTKSTAVLVATSSPAKRRTRWAMAMVAVRPVTALRTSPTATGETKPSSEMTRMASGRPGKNATVVSAEYIQPAGR